MQRTHITRNMRAIAVWLWLVVVAFASVQQASAQCNNLSAYGSATAPAAGVTTTITTCQYASEYATISSVVAGNSYTSTSSVTTDWITVRQGTPGGTVIAFGQTPLTWTATVGGTYYIHYNTNSSCGTLNTCRTSTIIGRGVGCNNPSAYGTFSAPTTATLSLVVSCQYAGEYATMNSAVAGAVYQVSSTVTTDWFTVRQGSPAGPIVAFGPSTMTFYTAVAGTYYIHCNSSSACGVAYTCRNISAARLYTPVAAGCTNLSMYPSAFTAPAAGTTYTISTCQFQSEYNQMNSVVSGNTFVSTASIAGTYITVRYGTYNGAVVASGTTPLSWTATAGAGSYFMHYNTNAACGTATTCMTTTIQNTSPVVFDPCASIGTITACGVSNTTTIASGTGAWALGPYVPPGKEKLYTFTPATTGAYTITQSTNTGGSWVDYFFKPVSGGCNNTGWTFVQDLYGAPVTSVATMSLTAGVQYYIMLDPEYTTGTTVTFTINCLGCTGTPAGGTTLASPTAFCGGVGGTTSLSLSGAATGVGITYQWQSSPDGGVYTNIAGATLATYSPFVASTTYYRCMVTCTTSGFSSYSTPATVTVSAAPVGDVLADPIIIGALPYSTTGNNLSSNCWTNNIGQTSPDVYYRVIPSCNGTMNMSMCGGGTMGDTYIHILNAAGTILASNDDFGPSCASALASLNYTVTAGTTYYVVCEGYSTNQGTYSLSVSLTPTYVTYYADADGDTFGDAGSTTSSCSGTPVGYVTNSTDCNDANSSVYPGATEVCNGVDDDCDALSDDGLTFINYYADADGDGYGDAGATPVSSCSPVVGSVADNTDCNDTNSSIYPGATEVCNGVDDDCDALNDDGLTFTTYYADADGDGFGDAAASTSTCDGAPAGYISDNSDCDDTQFTYVDIDGDGFGSGSPVACGVNNNSDCFPLDMTYGDADSDGYGSDVLVPCGVGNSDDCDDTQLLYTDIEGDGFGSGSPVACGVANNSDCYPLDYTYTDADGDGHGAMPYAPCGIISNDDCDDTNGGVHPGAAEICNGLDEDCDGTSDDGLTFLNYYTDADGDGFGDASATPVNSCSPVAGSVTNNGDCDDTNSAINPSASEVCNGIDDNCAGGIDDGLTFLNYYTDADGDGFGDASATPVNSCSPVAGSVADNTDCNDANSAINPGAAELCNAIDDDCDGAADDGLVFTAYYADPDGDGFGSAAYGVSTTCDGAPAGMVANNDDCLEMNAAVYPGATEVCNGIDDDCDGTTDDGLPFTTYYADPDGDGFGSAAYGTSSTCDGAPAGMVANNDDCLEMNAAVYPGATEVCNGLDDDCDGTTDDGLPFTTYYADPDGDGYGSAAYGTSSTCDGAPAGMVATNDDCLEMNASVYPGASEVCNGIDDDCDGTLDDGLAFTTYYADPDGDGYGAWPYGVVSTCDGMPAGYSANTDDCAELNAAVYPGAPELCNAIDDDCNGTADDGLTFTTYYADSDADGFGNAGVTSATCDGAPAGYVADNTDCDDTYSTVYPGATEVCDGLDNDCDGEYDEAMVTATITPSGVVTICKDDPETLYANTGVGYTYQWFKNGNLIPGATGATYAPNKPAYYQVQVNIPEGCFALSAVTTIQTNPMPNANISAPNGSSLCTTVKLKASWDASYTWQWLLEGAPIAGATGYLYFPTVPGNYSCTITNTFGCSRTTATLAVTACKEGEQTTAAVQETFELYPNPAENEFMLDMELNTTAQDAQVVILNMVGAQVYAGTVGIDNGTIYQSIYLDDTTPSGMYIVKVLVADKEYTKQLVIQK